MTAHVLLGLGHVVISGSLCRVVRMLLGRRVDSIGRSPILQGQDETVFLDLTSTSPGGPA